MGTININRAKNVKYKFAKILLGNKDDLDFEMTKVVLTSDASQYAQQKNLPFLETSARDNKNVENVFQITKLALKRRLTMQK
ncbi:unnamed protein product [Didymodactylos carnosus]|uniref:Uncharacterized protein n=1 Tax=Didymodactylos carnosus TaxID=1234261 RepID=A0A815XTE6_9BILA|nr:unnamed protein product [Didymodactylos carnosus]CAF4423804.1 unnamed protein product [Didymodactylos carnosus]